MFEWNHEYDAHNSQVVLQLRWEIFHIFFPFIFKAIRMTTNNLMLFQYFLPSRLHRFYQFLLKKFFLNQKLHIDHQKTFFSVLWRYFDFLDTLIQVLLNKRPPSACFFFFCFFFCQPLNTFFGAPIYLLFQIFIFFTHLYRNWQSRCKHSNYKISVIK